MRRKLVFSLLMTAAMAATAGARGFTAVMIDIGNLDLFETKTYAAKRDGELEQTPQWKSCWQHRATGLERIGMIVRKKLPDGVTKELASAIWAGDKKAMRKAQELMRAARASDGTEFDGMYIIKSNASEMSIMGLGARPPISAKNPSKRISFAWSDAEPAKSAGEMDLALCRVSSPLDFGFNP